MRVEVEKHPTLYSVILRNIVDFLDVIVELQLYF